MNTIFLKLHDDFMFSDYCDRNRDLVYAELGEEGLRDTLSDIVGIHAER